MWTSEKTRNGGNLRAKSKVEILIGKKSKPVWYVGSGLLKTFSSVTEKIASKSRRVEIKNSLEN